MRIKKALLFIVAFSVIIALSASVFQASAVSYTAQGGSGSQTIPSTYKNNFTATSNVSWVTISKSTTSFSYTVAANYSTSSRSGTITYKYGTTTGTIPVSQSGATMNVSTSSHSSPYGGDQFSFSASSIVPSSMSVSVSDNASWVSTGSYGTNYWIATVDPNTSTSSRSATITVSAKNGSTTVVTKTISISQAGTPAPTLTVSPTSWSPSYGSASTSFSVSTNQSSWSYSSGASWISGSKSGSTLTLSVTANTSTSSRSGSVTVSAGGLTRTISVTQAGAPAPTLTVSPTSWSPTAASASSNFSVSTNQSSWSYSSGASWISGSKSGSTLALSVTANTSASSRSGSVTVSAGGLTRTITVTQDGATMTVSTSSHASPYGGDQFSFSAAVVPSSLSVSVSDNASWVSTGSYGTNYWIATVDENTSTSSRSATITVSASNGITRTISVTQAGAPAPTLTVSPTSWSPTAASASSNFSVSTNQSSWSYSSGASWITGSKSGSTLALSVTANTSSSSRSGSVTVSAGGLTRTITVTQDGVTMTVSTSSHSSPTAGDTFTFTATTVPVSQYVKVTCPSWISLSEPTNHYYNVTVSPNLTASQRTGTITVEAINGTTTIISKTITVTQDGVSMTVSASSHASPSVGDQFSFSAATVPSSLTVRISDNASWVSTGSYGTNYWIADVAQNTTTDQRSAVITLEALNGSTVVATKTIAVTQAGTVMSVSTASHSSPVGGDTFTFTVSPSYLSCSVTPGASWITYGQPSQNYFNVTVAPNTTAAQRSANITISSGSVSKTITVTQEGVTMTVSASSHASPAAGDTFTFTATTNPVNQLVKVTKSADWITTSEPTNHYFNITVAKNTTTSARTGTITVEAVSGGTAIITKTITVTQAADPVSLTVSTASHDSPAAGDQFSFSATVSPSGLNVKITPSASWITSGSYGTNYWIATVAPNTSASSRSGTIKVEALDGSTVVATKTINVTQAGISVTMTVSTASHGSPGAGDTFTFTATTNPVSQLVKVTETADWISMSEPINHYYNVTVAPNTTGKARSATITVDAMSGSTVLISKTITVTQAVADVTMTMSSESHNSPGEGETFTFTATTNPVDQHVKVTETADWISVSEPTNHYYQVTVLDNKTGTPRNATITVQAMVGSTVLITKKLVVTQNATTLKISTSYHKSPAAGDSFVFTTTTYPANATVKITRSAEWIATSEPTSHYFIITVAPNTTTFEKTAVITVEAGEVKKTINVVQEAGQVLNFNAPEISLGSKFSDTMHGPKISFLGMEFEAFSMDVGIDLPQNKNLGLSLANDAAEKKYKLSIGLEKSQPEQDPKDSYWKQNYANIKQLVGLAGKNTSSSFYNKFRSMRGVLRSHNLQAGFQASGSVTGYMEWDYSTGAMRFSEGGLVIAFSTDLSFKYPLPPAPVVYLKFGIELEASGAFKLVLQDVGQITQHVTASGTVGFSATPYMGVGLDVLIANVEAGLKGAFEAEIGIPSAKFTLDFTGKMYLKYSVLFWGDERTWDFPKIQLYPRKASLMSSLAGIQMDDLKPLPRDYLKSGLMARAAIIPGVIKANTYPYGEPQLIKLPSGGDLLVFIDDDGTRSDENRTTLKYSVNSGSGWSAPAAVLEDGTADFSPRLASDGEHVYLAWQNSNRILPEGATLTDALRSVDVSFAKFDGAVFTDFADLTGPDNTAYEKDLCIAARKGEVSVAYIINSENDHSGLSGTNSIVRRRMTDSVWQEAETLASGRQRITSHAIGYNGELCVSAFTEDLDGDAATQDDCELFYINGSTVQRMTDDERVDYGASFSDGELFWMSDKTLRSLSGAYAIDTADRITGYRVLSDAHGGRAIVWEVTDGFKNEAYCSYYDAAEHGFGGAVPITSYGGKIRDINGYLDEDGSINFAFNLINVSDSGEKPYGSVDLRVANMTQKCDVTVTGGAYATGDILPGNTVGLTIEARNNGAKTIGSFRLNVYGASGALLSSKTVSQALASGESAEFTAQYTLPANLTRHTVKTEILPLGFTDSNPADNVSQIELGYADLTVTGAASVSAAQKHNITVHVKNSGYDKASGVKVTLFDGSNFGNVIGAASLADIAAGQSANAVIMIDDSSISSPDGIKMIFCSVETQDPETLYNNNGLSYVINELPVVAVAIEPGTIVADHQTNLSLRLSGVSFGGRRIEAHLAKDGFIVGEIYQIASETSVLRLQSAPAAGTYTVEVRIYEGTALVASGSAPLEIVNPPANIWSPSIISQNGKLGILFGEEITLAPTFSVKLNGSPVTASQDSAYSILTDKELASVLPGSKIIITGIKYPRLYPSYSFSFTIER